ncbi:O-methyltransferase [Myxococcota bacterium]|nr:O-methyltransferase [Myxococcota bacterium]MCZ7619331.1 class I SAM-dependent methyltransferase [Myxococcota bacterium]
MDDPQPLKSLGLSPALHAYLVAHGTPPDAVASELIEETAKLGPISIMQIAPEQAAFLTLMVRLLGAREVVEIGTFTGYSALALARGLPPDGRLLCCDVSEQWTAIARRAWTRAGVADRISLRIAPAVETLRALPETPRFDLAFIDADKPSYPVYYEELLVRTRVGGLILVDNVLWNGAVVDPDQQDEHTRAIRAFNDAVAADPRVDCVMTAIADGLTLLRKR